jgi:GAF domain-containing protein
MAEELIITGRTKEDRYSSLLPQLTALVEGESDLIANLGNISAALKETFGFLWVGFYLVKDNELVLGPFQGPVACTRIQLGKGVCGTAWLNKETIVVQDVDEFPGHIACSSFSRSEIVVPIFNSKQEVVMVLDVDSVALNSFNKTDQLHLEKLAGVIQTLLK